jgi:hypothetical protein
LVGVVSVGGHRKKVKRNQQISKKSRRLRANFLVEKNRE